jgi:hypothetical protein
MTWDTVVVETPARFATSCKVAITLLRKRLRNRLRKVYHFYFAIVNLLMMDWNIEEDCDPLM